MKSQDEFVSLRRGDWDQLDKLTAGRDALYQLDGPAISLAAALYRSLCADVTWCKTARYTPDLYAYLNGLAARSHGALYGARPFRMPGARALLFERFPRALRKNASFFAVAAALFLAPWALGGTIALFSPGLATKIIPVNMLEQMARDYAKSISGRELPVDTGMAGFYVYNNVGIAFRCFATGIFFGLGSAFFLVYNGLVTGIVTGYVMHEGYGANIWTFMCGHAPFEITAIVVAGTAGLRMGWSLVDTGGITRVGSLRRSAPEIAYLVLGAASMLVIAAVIEAFWSPSHLPYPVKWIASFVFTALVSCYLLLAGRSRSLLWSVPRGGARP
jgi:uncharacterized membrane protein SpoIIM required for sporulation